MKKTILNIFSFAAAVMALTACSPETNHVFDEDASQRMEEFNAGLQKTLMAAPNGWRMEYYASSTYGGYNMLLKFTENQVTAASEQFGSSQPSGIGSDGKAVTATSHYNIDQSMGSILSFDTYNEVIHYYSDPKNPDGIGTDGEGMSGDFEFRVQSYCADSVVLKGKKNGKHIVMYPIPEDQTWEELLTEISTTDDYMNSSSYDFIVEGSEKDVSVVKSYRRLLFTYQLESGSDTTVYCPYITTPEGYKFYEPGEIDGTSITGFLKGDTNDYFISMNNSQARIETYMPTLAESLETGMWFISYDYLGEYAQPSWDAFRIQLQTTGINKTKERLYWAFIGTSSGKTGMFLNAGGTSIKQGITFTALNDDADEVRLKWNSSVQSNKDDKNYYNKYGLKEAMEPFVGSGSTGRRFKLTTDSQRHPSYMILSDMDEPTNVIKLFYNQVTYVFGDRDADND